MSGNRECPDCKGTGKASTDSKPDAKAKPDTKAAAPYSVKRLHDMLCCAYDWDSVVDEYPAVEKDGLALALGPTAKGILYQLLVSEVAEDAGSGSGSYDVLNIAKAYDHLCSFLIGEAYEQLAEALDGPVILADARAHLHKLFKDVNPLGTIAGGHATWPRPGTVQPGMFRRPYLTGGHARHAEDNQSGAGPRIPASDTITAGDFGRTDLNASHERPAAGSTKGDRTFYTNQARDSASEVMAAVHDHIAQTFPALCPTHIGTTTTPPTPPVGTVTPGTTVDMRTGNGPTVVAAAAEPDLTKVATDTATIQAIVDAATGPLLTKMAALQSQVEQLESEPDPTQAPFRGGRTTDRATIEKQAQQEAETQRTAEKAAKGAEEAEYLGMLNRVAQSGDPELRQRAEAVLNKMATSPPDPLN